MKEYIRIPVFSENRLEGYFRFKDIFQIYPFQSKHISIPDNADVKPMIFEFCYTKIENNSEKTFLDKAASELNVDSDFLDCSSRAYNESNCILNFLTVITNFRFFYYTKKKCWIQYEIAQQSKIGYKNFDYPQLEEEYPLNIERLSENLLFNPIPVVEYDKYIVEGTRKSEGPILIHSEFNQLLNKYYSLSQSNKNKLDSICRLYREGLNLEGSSKSIPFIIFTSCIEALTNIEFEQENKEIKHSCDCKNVDDSPYKCKKCNKPIWGMSFKFKKILKLYAEDSESANKFYNRWYNIRSEIIHYGKLLLADTEISWDNEEKLTEQSINLRKVRQVTRIAIINWMLNSTMAK